MLNTDVTALNHTGWRPALAPNDERTAEELFQAVRQSLRGPDTDDADLHATTRAVLQLLSLRLSEGQIRHVRAQLPEEIQALWAA